ncbi:unnamed protein product [Rotaria magnacalcarata]|uniref:BED-type domain-containing protein n=2 Tax=Rotaria magnacalcarata TaxID=392030 RepID=A0A815FJ88_9BILA|nr:unnamed protein product [Rotaria magnacalcarata]CAF3842141.1 unnamed protein product [Rotaria magnacalcarata]CAF4053479.1 unnamed protein product [Rotaria magnacalcarata]CAF4087935.1 unnamed protein product [Rotaria magnacalcarata]
MVGESWREYFEFSSAEKNRTNGLCKLCNRNYKDQNGIFSNFLKHLKRVHPNEYCRIFNLEEEFISEGKHANDDDSTATASTTETLNKVNHVTLTIDGWSDRRCRSFLGITCHFIDDKMIPQAYLIDFVRLKSPHTGENIQQLTEDVLDEFEIKEKVFKIITDNASSMIKAYKFGLLVDEETDKYGDISKSMSGTAPMLDDYDHDIELNDFQVIDVCQDDDIDDPEDPATLRLSCFAHTLVLGKCQALAKFSHKSSKVADLLDELNQRINKTNVTRWNSEYLLIKSILLIGKNDLESITKLMDNSITFSNKDFTVLEEIINILEPFYEISIKCQVEAIVTASLVVPAVVHLVTHLRDIKENLSFCTKLAQQLQSSLEIRFAGIIKRLNQDEVENNDPFSDSIYFMAAALDPQFKFYWIRDLRLPANAENRLKQNILQLILDYISKYVTTSSTNSSHQRADQSFSSLPLSSLSSATFSSSTPKPKRRKLFNYNDDNNDESNDSTSMDAANELEAYINDPVRSRFSEYWLNSPFSILKTLVIRIFSVQASSAPVGRVFSYAGLILSPRRANMNEKLFKDLIFLKVNQHLL